MGEAYTAIASELIAKRQRKQVQPLINAQTDLAKQQAANAATLSPYIGQYYQRAGEAFDPAFQHYRALASGDRSTIMGAVAPQLADVNSRYGALIGASRELAPRSGAGAAYNADLGFRAADEGQRIISAERNSAYPALASMAGQAAGIGASAAGMATGAGQGASGMFGTALNSGRQLAGDQAAAYAQAAQSLYSAYRQYMGNRDSGSGNGKPASGSTDQYAGGGGAAWNGD